MNGVQQKFEEDLSKGRKFAKNEASELIVAY